MLSRRMLLAACLTAAAWPAGSAEARVTLFAAASLKTALDALVQPFHAATGMDLRCVYASSAALARQIDQGAPADLFWSADREWMEWCKTRDLVRQDTVRELLGNTLVLIAPAHAPFQQLALSTEALRAALGTGRIATAETRSVPAGRYARDALITLGLWDWASAHLAETDNARAALLLTARGEAPLGIVYASDAHAEPRVKIVAEFPTTSHRPIVYPVAITRNAPIAPARAALDFLQTGPSRDIFRREGFSVLPPLPPS